MVLQIDVLASKQKTTNCFALLGYICFNKTLCLKHPTLFSKTPKNSNVLKQILGKQRKNKLSAAISQLTVISNLFEPRPRSNRPQQAIAKRPQQKLCPRAPTYHLLHIVIKNTWHFNLEQISVVDG